MPDMLVTTPEHDDLLDGAPGAPEAPEAPEAPAKPAKAAADPDKGLKKYDAHALQLYRSGAFGFDELQRDRIRAAGYNAKSVLAAVRKG